jgi:hypothetical protein
MVAVNVEQVKLLVDTVEATAGTGWVTVKHLCMVVS